MPKYKILDHTKADGKSVEKGAVIELADDEAAVLVRLGKAELHKSSKDKDKDEDDKKGA